jgi:signal transduction histidine kinase
VRVFIVDDDPEDTLLTRSILGDVEDETYEIVAGTTYQEGLEGLLAGGFDVALLDYRLGPRTGLELLREAVAAGCRQPMILLTGQGAHDVDVEAARAGAADYLVKSEITPLLLERSIRYGIERKRVEAELAELQQRLAESPERERLHLARELHDGPLQDLIGTRFRLGVLSDETAGPEEKWRMAEAQASLQTVIHTLRAICGELRPPSLAPFGLERAIRSHARSFQLSAEIPVDLDLDQDGMVISERTRLALFRIYQTAMANIAQHAEASRVSVTFRMEGNELSLAVEDDGIGFEVPGRWIDMARRGHLGLVGAGERAEAIGGRLDIESRPGEGTVLRVTAPVELSSDTLAKGG